MADAYVAALRILQHRWNSIAELRRKLARKEFTGDEIDGAIEKLTSEGWLDDERFAGALVRTKTRRRVGPMRIRQELQAAGVGRETAARAIAENVDRETELEQLRALCEKRNRILVRRLGDDFLTTDEGRNKLVGYLLKQGYDAALVLSVVRDLTRENRSADHQRDP
jgi:regulatory protein